LLAGVPHFLAELYRSASARTAAGPDITDLVRAADQLTRNGRPVRVLLTAFVAEDETCFYLFRADTANGVADAGTVAGMAFARVVETELGWAPGGHEDPFGPGPLDLRATDPSGEGFPSAEPFGRPFT
jgi:hypothetical protein